MPCGGTGFDRRLLVRAVRDGGTAYDEDTERCRPQLGPACRAGTSVPKVPPGRRDLLKLRMAANESTESEPTPISPEMPSHLPFPIVGIGASAGGLEAITELLQHLP